MQTWPKQWYSARRGLLLSWGHIALQQGLRSLCEQMRWEAFASSVCACIRHSEWAVQTTFCVRNILHVFFYVSHFALPFVFSGCLDASGMPRKVRYWNGSVNISISSFFNMEMIIKSIVTSSVAVLLIYTFSL